MSDGGNISGSTTPVLTITNVLGADGSIYSVSISNAAALVASSNASLTVIDPIITSQPVSRTNNLATAASFTVAAYGTAPQYRWLKNGVTISGANTATYSIPSVAVTDEAAYSVVVSKAFGIVTSAPPAALTVISPPVITSQPLSRTNNAGTTATFSVTYTGTTPTLQWYKGVLPIANETNATLTLLNVQQTDAADYSVVLSNVVGTVTSSNAHLTVIDAPVIVSQPSSRTNNAGTIATFTVGYTGTAPIFQWFKNGTPLSNAGNVSGATSATLTLANVQDADVAGYTVSLNNAAGSVTSAPPATLTVINPPVITAQPLSRTNNAGTTATFTVGYTGTAPAFQWYRGVSPIFNETNATLTLLNVQQSDALNYNVVLSNAAGTVTSSNARLTVIDAPVITSQPLSRTNNAGTTATFTVGYTGTTPNFQWYKGVVPISNETNATLALLNVQQSAAQDYNVLLSNAAGTVTSSNAHLTVIDAPVITSQPLSRTNNAGTTATFTVGYTGTTPSIQWYKGVSAITDETNATLTLLNVQQTDAVDYEVVLSNAAGTVTSSNAHLTVIDGPVITAQPSSRTNNAGTTATFSVSYTGTSPSIQWFKNGTNALSNGGNISGANTPTLTLSNVFGIDRGIYSVVVSNAAAVVVSSNATLAVVDPFIVSQPVGVTNINGSTVTFSVGVTGTAPLSYQWYQDGFLLPGETGSSLTLTDIADSDAGDYTVVVTNIYGSATSASAVLVTVPPLIVTQPTSVIALVGQAVHFSVNVNGATPFSYQWQQNGTNVSGGNNRILSFANVALSNAGSYRVFVTNPSGTQLSSAATLSVYTSTVPQMAIVYSNGIATVVLTGVPTYNYAIQASTNLLNWTPIQTNVSPFTFIDTNRFNTRFYRGIYLP